MLILVQLGLAGSTFIKEISHLVLLALCEHCFAFNTLFLFCAIQVHQLVLCRFTRSVPRCQKNHGGNENSLYVWAISSYSVIPWWRLLL